MRRTPFRTLAIGVDGFREYSPRRVTVTGAGRYIWRPDGSSLEMETYHPVKKKPDAPLFIALLALGVILAVTSFGPRLLGALT